MANIILTKKAVAQEIREMMSEYGEYVKVVVDIDRRILVGGSTMHYEAEQLLLKHGSQQQNLWGAGVDLKTKKIDYDSMINIRPSQSNPSRIVASPDIREKIDKIITALLL